MGFIRVHCGYCSDTWDVYDRDKTNPLANQCPHCFKEIDRQTWEKQIIPAWAAMDYAGRELFKDHTGFGVPLFHIDCISNGNP